MKKKKIVSDISWHIFLHCQALNIFSLKTEIVYYFIESPVLIMYLFTNPKVMFVMDLSICHLISPMVHFIELLCFQWTNSQLFNVSIIGICVLRPFLPSKLYHHDENLPKLRLTGEDCTLRTPQQIQYVIHSIHQRYTHDFQSLKKSTYAPQ